MGYDWIPVFFVAAITLATIGLGVWATRRARTASDFFVAGRSVSVFWNASAISGEYLSAASFMGIAGMVMKNGYDALWYPVCYATGYLFLLLFIAGPLRRFGAYTIPDFAEGRFDSPLFRRIAVTFVLFIGFFYTMPQMKGAGITMQGILGWPYYVGILVVGAVISFNVALGGMKGITFVQAFQYWAKMFAICAPVFVLMSVFGGYNATLGHYGDAPNGAPRVNRDEPLKLKGAPDALAFSSAGPAAVTLPDGATIAKVGTARKLAASEDPAPDTALQLLPAPGAPPIAVPLAVARSLPIGAGATLVSTPFVVKRAIRGQQVHWPVVVDGHRLKTAAKLELAQPASAVLRSGSYVPNAPANATWLEPFGTLTGKYGYPLLYTYSLIIALVCGTAGLPHILVRFYTNPDGRAAKRTTLWVMVLIGAFYIFPPIWGALGRSALPSLYASGGTDSVVIKLPMALGNPLLGKVLSGITSAGAFAAFMSTFSGLLVSMAGAMAHDIYGKILRPASTDAQRLRAFKVSAVAFGAVAMTLGLMVERFDINMMVGWAFAIAAASYFPLLLLGSWWRGLTKYGAAVGMLTGGLLSVAAIVLSMLITAKTVAWEPHAVVRTLLEQPAIWAVPLSVGLMWALSVATAPHAPRDAHLKMLRLHAPEEMGLSRDYIAEA